MSRTLLFYPRNKARRFVLTVTIEVKRNYFVTESLLSHIEMQNGTFTTIPVIIPSDPKIRMQIHYA